MQNSLLSVNQLYTFSNKNDTKNTSEGQNNTKEKIDFQNCGKKEENKFKDNFLEPIPKSSSKVSTIIHLNSNKSRFSSISVHN